MKVFLDDAFAQQMMRDVMQWHAEEERRTRPFFEWITASVKPYREEQRLRAFDDGIPMEWKS